MGGGKSRFSSENIFANGFCPPLTVLGLNSSMKGATYAAQEGKTHKTKG